LALELELVCGLRSFAVDVRLRAEAQTLVLAGPSGAGKSTVLRAVAGLRRPDRGRIACGERVWFDAAGGIDVPPEQRRVGWLPQEHGLFPHLDVRRNVAFAAPGKARGDELLERLGIAALAGARPATLSGGERQRVALARALAREPDVLLLDEPLAALDARTRLDVRGELHDLLAGLRLPTLIVTHDFADAAVLADRIAILDRGRLRQEGTPAELLEAPADAFVAAFCGAHVLYGSGAGDGTVVLDDGRELRAPASAGRRGALALAVHPWEAGVTLSEPAGPALRGVIAGVTPQGDRLRVRFSGGLEADAPAGDAHGLEAGRIAWATFGEDGPRVLDAG
jgi:molybdate transport system ATP-binding protein